MPLPARRPSGLEPLFPPLVRRCLLQGPERRGPGAEAGKVSCSVGGTEGPGQLLFAENKSDGLCPLLGVVCVRISYQ